MNTAPTVAPVISREIAPGVTVDTSMTPEQRFQAILKANVAPSQFHTDGTVARFAQGDGRPAEAGTIAGKAAPPAPKTLERSNALPPQGNPSPARQAELDAELQAAGIQTRPDGRRIGNSAIDQEAIDLLTASYRTIATGVKDNPAAAARFKAAYEKDLAALLDGKQLTGAQIAELRKRAGGGNVESFVPKATDPPVPTPTSTPGWQSHIEDGEWIGLENLTTADTSGYTIPKWVDRQRVHISVIEQLKDAKATGITQAQVNAVLGAHARRNGWTEG